MRAQRSFNSQRIPESELILNPDGTLYHLGIDEQSIGDTVLIVGDPERVEQISRRFSTIDFKTKSREFCVHTGQWKGQRISVVSTGIGVDNVDIVMNEIDAAVNVNLKSRRAHEKPRSLKFVRIGTSGSMREEIPAGAFVASVY